MAAGVVLLVLGAGCAQFFLRYCTAHLVLDDGSRSCTRRQSCGSRLVSQAHPAREPLGR